MEISISLAFLRGCDGPMDCVHVRFPRSCPIGSTRILADFSIALSKGKCSACRTRRTRCGVSLSDILPGANKVQLVIHDLRTREPELTQRSANNALATCCRGALINSVLSRATRYQKSWPTSLHCPTTRREVRETRRRKGESDGRNFV
jgi:hypothetical protein